MDKTDFGVIGLGVMGKSLSLNIAENGFYISVYNRIDGDEAHIVSDFLEANKPFQNISGFTELKAFVNSLEKPRKILIMIKAGSAIDEVINQLLPFLSEGDILIDGGNSHYLDTKKRSDFLSTKNLHFVGCGVSGGEEGARKGPSIMPGGTRESYEGIGSILETISAKDKNNNPCCTYIGIDGAGHFIKMVHNGIEYAEMELLAEVYAMLKTNMNNDEIAEVLKRWNATNLSSYLLEITIQILQKKDGDSYLLDQILDKAGNKGTGSWSSKSAFDLGAVNTMMTSSVFARYISAFKDKRIALAKALNKKAISTEKPKIEVLESAYRFARIINHHQGFQLMEMASNEYNWNLNFSEIARIWTNGCIIRSDFMEQSVTTFKTYKSYFDDAKIFKILRISEKDIVESISHSLKNRIPFDTFWSAYNYWISITSENVSANLIQAQRDYFGAHTYQLKGDATNQFYHTNWQQQ